MRFTECLAVRRAFSYTGHETILSVREACHGWSIGADAVSSSVADNPTSADHFLNALDEVLGELTE